MDKKREQQFQTRSVKVNQRLFANIEQYYQDRLEIEREITEYQSELKQEEAKKAEEEKKKKVIEEANKAIEEGKKETK